MKIIKTLKNSKKCNNTPVKVKIIKEREKNSKGDCNLTKRNKRGKLEDALGEGSLKNG
jgi:hypothetical protein